MFFGSAFRGEDGKSFVDTCSEKLAVVAAGSTKISKVFKWTNKKLKALIVGGSFRFFFPWRRGILFQIETFSLSMRRNLSEFNLITRTTDGGVLKLSGRALKSLVSIKIS